MQKQKTKVLNIKSNYCHFNIKELENKRKKKRKFNLSNTSIISIFNAYSLRFLTRNLASRKRLNKSALSPYTGLYTGLLTPVDLRPFEVVELVR